MKRSPSSRSVNHEADAAKALPLSLGDVVVTTAGALPARHVFHVVTIGPPPDGTPEPNALDLISTAVDRCLELAQVMNLRSIAFPALGAGVARLPIEEVAVRLVGALAERARLPRILRADRSGAPVGADRRAEFDTWR